MPNLVGVAGEVDPYILMYIPHTEVIQRLLAVVFLETQRFAVRACWMHVQQHDYQQRHRRNHSV